MYKRQLLNGVSHRVTQIQKATLTLLLLVAFHNPSFIPNTPGDDLRWSGGQSAALKEGEQAFITEDAGLDGLRGAIGKDGGWESAQAVSVTEDCGGLEKDAG